jgi:phospholipid/cholesterol/gamma-HCH transport system substrate-binding protein
MTQTKVGLLVAVALAILMTTIFSLGQQERLWERKVPYEIHFARAGGLAEGAIVSLTGVPVGSVTEMRFPPALAAAYIEITVNVTGRVTDRIREDSVATIRTYGLLGDRYIELTAGSPDAPPIPPGGLIASIDPIDYEAVLGQSGDIVSNIAAVTASLKTILGSIERGEGLLGAMMRNRELGETTLLDFQLTMANLQETSQALEEILQRMNRGEGLIGHLTSNTKEGEALMASVNASARSLEQFTGRLNRAEGTLVQLVEDEAYGRRVLANLDRTLADLAELLAKVNRGDGTLGRLVNDPALYEDTQALIGEARGSWLLRLFGGGERKPEAAAAGRPRAQTRRPGPAR